MDTALYTYIFFKPTLSVTALYNMFQFGKLQQFLDCDLSTQVSTLIGQFIYNKFALFCIITTAKRQFLECFAQLTIFDSQLTRVYYTVLHTLKMQNVMPFLLSYYLSKNCLILVKT